MPKKKRTCWLLSIIAYTATTVLAAYLIHEESPTPLMALRFMLGFFFVSFAPGYCMYHLLFPKNEKNIIEEIVLSAALSFGIAGFIGLILGITGIGLSIHSVIISLSMIVLILAFSAFKRAAN